MMLWSDCLLCFKRQQWTEYRIISHPGVCLACLWRNGRIVRLDQCPNHWRCATHVQPKVKVRKAYQSSYPSPCSESTLRPACYQFMRPAANGRCTDKAGQMRISSYQLYDMRKPSF